MYTEQIFRRRGAVPHSTAASGLSSRDVSSGRRQPPGGAYESWPTLLASNSEARSALTAVTFVARHLDSDDQNAEVYHMRRALYFNAIR